MSLKDKIYQDNYFVNTPLKFYTNPKKIRDFFVGTLEILKIFLAKFGMLRWSFNERIIERPFVFQNLPKNKKAKILDIGCSDSIMPVEIAALGYETYGNDPRKYPFRYPKFKFIQGDALKLEFENYFDAITCISVIEHVGLSMDYSGKSPRKDGELMQKIKKMLKKKGILILTTPVGTKRILDNQHTRVYDSKELKFLFSGFKIIEERYFHQKNGVWNECSSEFLEKLTKNKFEETVGMFVLQK